ncbi:MAG TPA: hypothetical protein PLC53_03655, partial [Bacilli bacterium]|nr:hypothetical protein [Bacilli bacterium]
MTIKGKVIFDHNNKFLIGIQSEAGCYGVFTSLAYFTMEKQRNVEENINEAVIANVFGESLILINLITRNLVLTYDQENRYKYELNGKEMEDAINYMLSEFAGNMLIFDLKNMEIVYNLTTNKLNPNYFSPLKNVINNIEWYKSKLAQTYVIALIAVPGDLFRTATFNTIFELALKQKYNLLADDLNKETLLMTDFIIEDCNLVKKHADLLCTLSRTFTIRG